METSREACVRNFLAQEALTVVLYHFCKLAVLRQIHGLTLS